MVVTINATSHTVTIPDGNYGFTSMCAALITALNQAFAVETYEFDVTVDPTTCKLTIQCTNLPASTTVAVDTTGAPASKNTDWGLAYYLGFPKGVVTTGPTNTGTLSAPGIASLNPHTYLLLNIRELNGTDHVGMEGGNSTFGKIPLPVNSYNFVFYDKVLSKQIFSPPRLVLNRLHISFTLPDGAPVNFHGMEHSFTIELTCTNEKIVTRAY